MTAVHGRQSAVHVSVVIPLGARHEGLAGICQSLRLALNGYGPYEVLFVDDATGPKTRAELEALRGSFPEVRAIRLSHRMGEAAALAIGAQHAQGDIVVTLDPYLHVPIEAIPQLLQPLANGTDVVCVWRTPRQDSWLGQLSSASFNALARWLTKVPVHDLNCRTRVIRQQVLQELPLYGDLYRFLPIFAARRGYRWCEVQIPQQPGKHEVGAQDPHAYIRRFFDLLTLAFLTRFVKRPLHFFGLLGAASLSAGLLLSLYLTYIKVGLGLPIGHRPLLLLAVLLIVVGLQIASIGLLGELMIFTHARDLKDYVVKEEFS